MRNIEQSRRNFLKALAGTSAAWPWPANFRAWKPIAGGRGGPRSSRWKRCVRRSSAWGRGSGHVATMMSLEGVEIVAIADNHEPSLKASVARVKNAGRKEPAAYGRGDEDYKRMLERDDIDIVIIATPWEWHTRMCVDAMTRRQARLHRGARRADARRVLAVGRYRPRRRRSIA